MDEAAQSTAFPDSLYDEAKQRYDFETRARERYLGEIRVLLALFAVAFAIYIPALCEAALYLKTNAARVLDVALIALVGAAGFGLIAAAWIILSVFLSRKSMEYPPNPLALLEYAERARPEHSELKRALTKSYAKASEENGEVNSLIFKRLVRGKAVLRWAIPITAIAALYNLWVTC